ncbi:hypothetical protein [Methanosarcina sp.]
MLRIPWMPSTEQEFTGRRYVRDCGRFGFIVHFFSEEKVRHLAEEYDNF